MSTEDKKLELQYELLRILNSKSSTKDIQIGILKDTWYSEFGEDLSDKYIEEVKKTVLS